jgi:hypothetical protein
MKKMFFVAILILAVYAGLNNDVARARLPEAQTPARAAITSDVEFAAAYENRRSNLQIGGRGEVIKLLEDDNRGSRHQRFLVRLGSGQVLLFAHNIDLAPRIDSLRKGDSISFYGEYEWNEKGGVMHWTHNDPDDRHVGGWIEHNGKRFH